ncbi:MAG: HU family DNA-binding protein [Alicyclobacillus sp.]|nr:HU family DNA-binding protein [Alicyclobacillus sp.]
MTKSDLIRTVSAQTGYTRKEVRQVVETLFRAIQDALCEGEKVQLVGFGNFEARERAARRGRNPQTGEVIDIAASRVPTFRAGKNLRAVVR